MPRVRSPHPRSRVVTGTLRVSSSGSMEDDAKEGRMDGSNGSGWPLGGSNEIEVEGLVREFKGGIRAVDGVDLLVKPGEIYGFLGPNGAGKSTTVHVLTTLLPPTGGTARVGGMDVATRAREVREQIGAALQEVA